MTRMVIFFIFFLLFLMSLFDAAAEGKKKCHGEKGFFWFFFFFPRFWNNRRPLFEETTRRRGALAFYFYYYLFFFSTLSRAPSNRIKRLAWFPERSTFHSFIYLFKKIKKKNNFNTTQKGKLSIKFHRVFIIYYLNHFSDGGQLVRLASKCRHLVTFSTRPVR